MGRKADEVETNRAHDALADRYHEVGIDAVSAAARYCEPLKKQRREPAYYDVLNMIEPKTL
ncbi:MAG: hypothetical protein AB7O39_15445 [Flavobacteriaceae bacterium]